MSPCLNGFFEMLTVGTFFKFSKSYFRFISICLCWLKESSTEKLGIEELESIIDLEDELPL